MTVLCIGGLDPLGRAGLIVDHATCSALGVRAVVVCSALTAQDDESCLVRAVDADFFAGQLRVVFGAHSDLVVKVGWLTGEEQLKVLLDLLPDNSPLIVDPVLRTTSGVQVYGDNLKSDVFHRYIRRSSLLTPNLIEAQLWLETASPDPAELASRFQLHGASRVLLKGGHSDTDWINDFFIDHDGSSRVFRHERYTGNHRGTGCRLASAVAARVSQGIGYEQAIADAIDWLTRQIEAAAAANYPN